MMHTAIIELRPAGASDLPFLRQVYASTRLEELAPLGWSAGQRDAFLDQQFSAQHSYYQEHYAGAAFQVILREQRPVGRLYVARLSDEIRVIDLTLLPEYRNLGVGSRLFADLFAEAGALGLPVRIHVEKFNRALRLYERLGFTPIADRGVYWFMEWSPSR